MRYTSTAESIRDGEFPINRKFSAALNRFFKNNKAMIEGCRLKRDWDRADYALIIEESALYDELNNGISDAAIYAYEELGIQPQTWKVHTEFHQAFRGCGFHPEMKNSCVVGFYKD